MTNANTGYSEDLAPQISSLDLLGFGASPTLTAPPAVSC